jgi:hypothetical protein
VGDQHDVGGAREAMALVANALSQPALDPVADHRVSHLFADREADPAAIALAGEPEREHKYASDAPPTTLHPPKVRRPADAERTIEAEAHGPGDPLDQVDFVRTVVASRARPLARRLEITLRPPGVLMRARKPWDRFRLMLLGW